MLLTSYMDLLIAKLQKISLRNISVILVLIFSIVIFTNGVSLVPPQHYQRLSQNPFVTRIDIASDNYWQETVLLPVIAYYTQLNSQLSFNILCFSIQIIAYLLFAQLTFKQFGSVPTLIFTTILITSPLTTVILSWLGTPDSLTFALTIPFLFTNSGFIILILAILGTTNHIVFIIAASEILVLRWIAREKIKARHLITVAIGGTAGFLLVRLFLRLNQIEIMVSRLDYILSNDLAFWIKMNTANLPMSVFSLFNIQWLIIIVSIMMFFKMDKRYYSSLLIILLINFGIVFFSEDTTRIFSLLSWGILLECIFHSYRLALKKNHGETAFQNQYLLALIIIGLTSFITPRYYSWRGEIHTTVFDEFIRRVLELQHLF